MTAFVAIQSEKIEGQTPVADIALPDFRRLCFVSHVDAMRLLPRSILPFVRSLTVD